MEMVSKAPINKEMKLVEKKQGGEGKKDEDEIEKEETDPSRAPVPDGDDDDDDSEDDDYEANSVLTRNPAQLLKEALSKECELAITDEREIAKVERALCNLHYRSNVVSATTPDGFRFEFLIRPETGPETANLPQGPTELAEFQARVDELIKLKKALESGNPIPPKFESLVKEQKTPEHQAMLRAKRENTTRLLRTEAELMEQNFILKDALSLTRVKFNSAFGAFDKVMMLDVSPLTLKKCPEIVKTFRQLQDYKPNRLLQSGFSPTTRKSIEENAALIRNHADFVMEKFSALFDIPDGMDFNKAFYYELLAFQDETRGIPVGDIITLTE